MFGEGAVSEFVTAFVITLALMPVLMHMAPRWRLVDRPDERKLHVGEVPLVGGLAIFASLVLVLLIKWPETTRSLYLVLGSALVLAAGLVDDRHGLSAAQRFFVQTLACALMVFGAGVLLRDFGELLWPATLSLGWLAVPVTLFCVVGVTNAINMIDGMDGLSGSLGLVAIGGLLVATGRAGAGAEAMSLPMILGGGLSAFLLFNIRFPWRAGALAFLGDAGTLLLGFLLGWLLVEYSQAGARVIAPVTALWLLAVPLMDTVFVMIKRRRSGQSMVEADREHLHHAFLRSGFSVGQTLLLLVMAAAGLALAGLLLEWGGVPEYASFALFLSVCGAYYLSMTRAWRHRRFLGRGIQ